MLTIDGALLLGVLLCAPPKSRNPELLPSGPATVTAMWILGAISITAAMILPENRPNSDVVAEIANGEQTEPASDTSDAAPPRNVTITIPPYVTVKPNDWIGKNWRDIDFAGYVKGWPADLNTGRKYIIFFSRTCDHCKALLNFNFFDPPAPTILVAVPESKSGFDRGSELPMLCPGCVELELPIGTDWLLTPPLVVALEDGVVRCAAEGVDGEAESPECLLWH
jgi:hypothetical protein